MDLPSLMFFMITGFCFVAACFCHADNQTEVNYGTYGLACLVFALADIAVWWYLWRKFWGVPLKVDMANYRPPDLCPVCLKPGTETRPVQSRTPTALMIGPVHVPVPHRYHEFPVRLCLLHASEVDLGRDSLKPIRVRVTGIRSSILNVEIRSARYRQAVVAAMNQPEAPEQIIAGLAQRLAPLASLAVQRQFMVNGSSRDGCLLPEEVLEGAHEMVRYVDSVPAIHQHLGEAVPAIQGLAPLLKQIRPESCRTLRQLVEDHPDWCRLRQLAGACLAAWDFDLPAWESGFRPATAKPVVVVRERHVPRYARILMVAGIALAGLWAFNEKFVIGGTLAATPNPDGRYPVAMNDGGHKDISRQVFVYQQVVGYLALALGPIAFPLLFYYGRKETKLLQEPARR